MIKAKQRVPSRVLATPIVDQHTLGSIGEQERSRIGEVAVGVYDTQPPQ
jgi:hypothetical protein